MPFTKKVKPVTENDENPVATKPAVLADLYTLPAPYTEKTVGDGEFNEIGDLSKFMDLLQNPSSLSTEDLEDISSVTFQAMKTLQDEWLKNQDILACGLDDFKLKRPQAPEPASVFEEKKEAGLYGYRHRADRGAQQDPWDQAGLIPSARDQKAMEMRHPENPGYVNPTAARDGQTKIAMKNPWAFDEKKKVEADTKAWERFHRERERARAQEERKQRKRTAAAADLQSEPISSDSVSLRKRGRSETASAALPRVFPRGNGRKQANPVDARNSSRTGTLTPSTVEPTPEAFAAVEDSASPGLASPPPQSPPSPPQPTRKRRGKAEESAAIKRRKGPTSGQIPIAPHKSAGNGDPPTNGVTYPSSKGLEGYLPPETVAALPSPPPPPTPPTILPGPGPVAIPSPPAKAKAPKSRSKATTPAAAAAATTTTKATIAPPIGSGVSASLTDDEIKAMLSGSANYSTEKLTEAMAKIRASANPRRTAAMYNHWENFRGSGKQRKQRRSKAQMEADRLAAEAARNGGLAA